MQNGPGTNYFAVLDDNVSIALTTYSVTDTAQLAVLAICNGNPNVVAVHPNTYATGCSMIRVDILTGENVYQMTGTYSVPAWTLIGSGGGSIGGTIDTTQVAFGTALDTIGGDPLFTYDGSALSVPKVSLPYGSGTPIDPDIFWYDPIHLDKKGIWAADQAIFIGMGGAKNVRIEDNGGTPYLWAGRIDSGLSSFATFYESSGLQGIADGSQVNGSNSALGLTAPASIPGNTQPQYNVCLSAVKSTDDVPEVLDTRTLSSSDTTTVMFEWRVVGRRLEGTGRDGDSVSCILRATFSGISGVATPVGFIFKELNATNDNANVELSVSGEVIELIVTGVLGDIYQWHNSVVMQMVH